MVGEELYQAIDQTLDQLIKNAETIAHVDLADLTETELDAFQKTQESLLHHLLHIDAKLAEKKAKARIASPLLQQKRQRFDALHSHTSRRLAAASSARALLSKRRAKRFIPHLSR